MHTHSTLRESPPELLQTINQSISDRLLKNGLGQTVTDQFDAGLVNESATYFYPIVNGVIQMLRDEIIDLETIDTERIGKLDEEGKTHE